MTSAHVTENKVNIVSNMITKQIPATVNRKYFGKLYHLPEVSANGNNVWTTMKSNIVYIYTAGNTSDIPITNILNVRCVNKNGK